MSKPKNYGSKHNLDKNDESGGTLPKITPATNFFNAMQGHKKTYYSKKLSNDFNFTIFNGKNGR